MRTRLERRFDFLLEGESLESGLVESREARGCRVSNFLPWMAGGKRSLRGRYWVCPALLRGRSWGRYLLRNQCSICLVEKGPCCLPAVSR